ncbi:MAG: hypothetical protein Greene041662_468 [Candidatus Peregrinibacteria bacterium Greene0416_62]|nr:MAG: hypothetical protein Greene041662_468 [Candidatus Peregrinibacteria bacterium Greene0416_62]TSC96663.1 MAG: hypothetical protein Greene101449_1409 [Candidatus Peregrinibacteria bacterium Greene1014_49]
MKQDPVALEKRHRASSVECTIAGRVRDDAVMHAVSAAQENALSDESASADEEFAFSAARAPMHRHHPASDHVSFSTFFAPKKVETD